MIFRLFITSDSSDQCQFVSVPFDIHVYKYAYCFKAELNPLMRYVGLMS